VGVAGSAALRRYSVRGKKLFGKSIEIYKTNKIMKWFEKWFKNVVVVVLGS